MKQRRRKTDKPGWYASIIPAEATRTACSRCGTKTAYLDQQNSECLRCVLERRKAARGATPTA